MADSIGLSDWAAEGTEQRSALTCSAVFLLAAVLVVPWAHAPLPTSYPLLAMILSASFCGAAIIALLLLLEARALESPAIGVLSAGFGFAAAITIPYALFYPGMFGGVPSSESTAGLLWFFWHAGLLAAILIYDRLRAVFEHNDPRLATISRAVVAAFVVAFVGLVWFALGAGAWAASFVWFMPPVIGVLGLAAILVTLRRGSHATVLDVWLGVVAFAVVLDVSLSFVAAERFTLGWYASRIGMLLATTSMLGVLVSQAARMYVTLVERAEELEGEAHTDALTGLANRRRFDEEFSRAFGAAVRRGSALAIAMIDIDHFKLYNDSFGHQAGDDALARIAQAIADSVERSGDFAARYGGEEFVVILEDTALDGALAVAERIRAAVFEERIATAGGGILSISVGVAARRIGDGPEQVIRHADEALYAAKDQGRNRVVAFSEPAAERSTASAG